MVHLWLWDGVCLTNSSGSADSFCHLPVRYAFLHYMHDVSSLQAVACFIKKRKFRHGMREHTRKHLAVHPTLAEVDQHCGLLQPPDQIPMKCIHWQTLRRLAFQASCTKNGDARILRVLSSKRFQNCLPQASRSSFGLDSDHRTNSRLLALKGS